MTTRTEAAVMSLPDLDVVTPLVLDNICKSYSLIT